MWLTALTTLTAWGLGAPAHAYPAHWFACGQHPDHQAAMTVPCSEIDRAVGEAADEFGLDHRRFRLLARCESHFKNAAGRSHVGVYQQAAKYWRGRVNDFNRRHPHYPVGLDASNPFWNARVSADMIARGQARHWSCRY
jgi:hypothetical protein